MYQSVSGYRHVLFAGGCFFYLVVGYCENGERTGHAGCVCVFLHVGLNAWSGEESKIKC